MQLRIISTQGRSQKEAGLAKTLPGNALAFLAMAQLVIYSKSKGASFTVYSLHLSINFGGENERFLP